MILCIEQGQTVHVVYEVEEPPSGGIGALTAIDLEYAHAHARKLIEHGHMAPIGYTIALHGAHGETLDRQPAEAKLGPVNEVP